jgi:hypothetical protein
MASIKLKKMRSLPFLLLLVLICGSSIMAQQKSSKSRKEHTGHTQEELSTYYSNLAKKRTRTGGILMVSGGVAAGIGTIVLIHSLNSERTDLLTDGDVIGALLFAGGTACTITGGFMVIYGSVLRRKARLAVVNEPVAAYRIGAPTRMPSLGLQISLGSK